MWFGDERCVPPDHPHSNYGMARAALLDAPRGRPPAVLRMEGELGPDAGAGAYEAAIRERLGAEPRWDLLLLGPGAGRALRVAVPRQARGEEIADRLVAGVPLAGMPPQVPRITLTLPCLNAARAVVFLVTGADKARRRRARRSATTPTRRCPRATCGPRPARSPSCSTRRPPGRC